MITSRSVIRGLLLPSVALGYAHLALAEPPALPSTAAPVAQSEALGMAIADAVGQSTDCATMGQNLEAAIASQTDAIKAIVASDAPDSGMLSDAQQAMLQEMVERAKHCAGKIDSAALKRTTAELATRVQGYRNSPSYSALLPSHLSRAKPLQLESTSSCENGCCIKGWQTWAAVTTFTIACAGGDDQACCMATTIASYNACVNTYCPTNDCCQNVPVNPPDPPE